MLLAAACAALVIAISPTADVSPTLVARVIDEANAIWTPAGVTLVVQQDGVPSPALAVVIGPERGTAHAYDAPIGWIEFDDGRPQPRLYLSLTNARVLFESERGVVGLAAQMPILERETYLGRALGRALAHELGHYLLAAKTHTAAGLMKANFTAAELFLPNLAHFAIAADQQAIARARLDQASLVAAATSGSSSPTSRPPASPPRAAARWRAPTPRS